MLPVPAGAAPVEAFLAKVAQETIAVLRSTAKVPRARDIAVSLITPRLLVLHLRSQTVSPNRNCIILISSKQKKRNKKVIAKKVKQALKTVGMTDYEYRDVDSLSGGQQQRVA